MRGGTSSIWRRDKYSFATSERREDRGLKLSMIVGISIGIICFREHHELSRTFVRRFAYLIVSSGHFDKACLMKEP